MREARLIERVWAGTSVVHRLARAALLPLAAAFRGGTALRNALYDHGLLDRVEGAIPVISVGNLAVGGTGKTPVAAWIAAELKRSGARPAIVLRGYGGDEPLVHRVLNPGVPVFVAADRAAGVDAAAKQGATVAVLDDAFQHRQMMRTLDLVLVAAEDFPDDQRLLPAGPWREPLSALCRASAALVIRKTASESQVGRVLGDIQRAAPGLPAAVVSLEPGALHTMRGDAPRLLETLAGRDVLAIAAVARPAPFLAQLERTGARVTARIFPDHHAFSDDEVHSLAAESALQEFAVCTLKDAVKLDPRWPRAAASLWYVSQRVVPGEGSDVLQSLLARVR